MPQDTCKSVAHGERLYVAYRGTPSDQVFGPRASADKDKALRIVKTWRQDGVSTAHVRECLLLGIVENPDA